MGNSVLGGRVSVSERGSVTTKFYTSAAWIEGRAEDQLRQVSDLDGVTAVAGFPDLHPGKYGPVGCAVLADRIYPQLIGSDIGCGMSLFQLDLPLRKFKLEKAVRRMRALGEAPEDDYSERLEETGLSHDLFATALGTIGGGNHFCEVQTLAKEAPDLGLDKTRLFLLVHSGSRGFGSKVFAALAQGAFSGMDPQDEAAQEYLCNHNKAVLWASLNRQIIAQRAATALRADLQLVVDAPHNLLTHEVSGWLHRKGAARADIALVPLAGSRATPSYLLRPKPDVTGALCSTAHGMGRRFDRSSMHGRVRAKKSDIAKMQNNPFGGRVICEDKGLLVEESPHAYKFGQTVVADLEATGVAQCVATFHPLLTFKKIRREGRR